MLQSSRFSNLRELVAQVHGSLLVGLGKQFVIVGVDTPWFFGPQ